MVFKVQNGAVTLAKSEDSQRIKFDLPPDYIRAIHVRAAYDGIYPREVIVQSLDKFLSKELAEVRERMGMPTQTPPLKKRGGRAD